MSAVSRRASRPVPPILLLQATTFVSTLDRFAMPPLLVAIATDLGVPLSQAVHAAGAYFLVYGLCQPLWGVVSDQLGRVRTLRLTLLAAGVCTLLSATAETITALVVARALAGGLFGAAYPSTLVYVGDTVPAAVRQRDITRLMVGVALGTSLASVAAGSIAAISWRWAFVATGAASLVLVVLLGRLAEPDAAPRSAAPLAALGHITRSRITLVVLGFAFVEGAVLLGALTLLPAAVEYDGASAALAGAVTGIYGVAVYAGSVVVGRLSARWHPARLIRMGAAAAVVGCGLLAWSRSPEVAAVVAALLGLAWTSLHSSLQTWATEVLPGARATVVSLFASSLFVGSAAAAALVAGWAGAGRYSLIYAICGGLVIPLGATAAWARSRWQRPMQPS